MKRFLAGLIILASTFLADESFAQWKKIADFIDTNGINYSGEYISCVYFLDLPGPPRIGYVSTYDALYKTTDGGGNWAGIFWPDTFYGCITDISFKDSLTGWVAIFNEFGNSGAACFRTTDAGINWIELPVPGVIFGADGVCFNTLTKRLFLSSIDSGLLESTDLGNTWFIAAPYDAGNFSFSSDSDGIVPVSFTSTDGGYLITTDGGVTWDTTHINRPIGCQQPLAIPGTPICFEADYGEIIVRRSDDYGHTWRELVDFGVPYNPTPTDTTTAPSGTGVIRGDLTHLYIQADSGMFLSTDEGLTWQFDGGPTFETNATNDIFYSANGVTIAGMTYNGGGFEADGGLWEETWPQAGVAEHEDTNSGSGISVFPNPATSSITVMSSLGPLSIFDPLGRTYTVPRNGNGLDISTLPAGVYFISDGVSRAKFVKTSR